MPDIRRVLKVVFIPDSGSEQQDVATIAIVANNFMYYELATNEFLVMIPGEHYGGEREMHDDLNENAIGGKYQVTRASPGELQTFERSGGILHN